MQVRIADIAVAGIPGGRLELNAGKNCQWPGNHINVGIVFEGPRKGWHGYLWLSAEKAKELSAALLCAAQELDAIKQEEWQKKGQGHAG